MGTEASRLNSGIQGYMENYSWLSQLIYRKGSFLACFKMNASKDHLAIRKRSIASNSKIYL